MFSGMRREENGSPDFTSCMKFVGRCKKLLKTTSDKETCN